MGNALEFILKLTDMLTPSMRAAASITDSACGRIQRDFNNVNASSKQMSASVNELRERLEAVNKVRFGTRLASEFNNATRQARDLEKQIERLESKGQKSSGGGGLLSSIVGGNLVTSAIGAIGSAVMAGGRAVIGGASKQDQDLTGLTTFLGAAGAKDAYKNIKSDAAVTPFDTAGLLMVNRSLISAGLNAKDARRDTMNLANAISAVGGGNDELSRMAANMQQIKTVGKATAMDVRQFGYAGINIYKILADATGKSIDQVKTMDVSYDLLSKSLQRAAEKGGAYFGAMEAQSKTIPGKWSTFMDNIHNAAADIGTSLKPLIMWFIDMGINLTNSFANVLSYVGPIVNMLNGIPSLMDSINSPSSLWYSYLQVIRGVLNAAWETIKSLAANVWHIVSGIVEGIGKSVLLKDIFFAIGAFAQGIYWFIQKIGDLVVWIWDTVVKPFLIGIDWAYKVIKGFLGGNTEIQVNHAVKTAAPDAAKMPQALLNPINLNGDRSSKVSSADLSANGGKLSKSRADSINSGGQRSIVITINKMIEKIEMNVLDGKQGAEETTAIIRQEVLKMFYSLNGAINA